MICPSCRALNPDSAEVCFQCREVLPGITRGTVLASRYEIESTLGKGGMGVVYAAHDRVLDEKVALKTLRADFTQDAEVLRRFRSEIKLARRVGHRNVCRIYEYGDDHGVRFISMEYVEGIDLRTLLRRRGPLRAAEAFDITIQVARGVEAVHEVGIVHRDLKATNIMVDPRGVVRLMDFGIARQHLDGEATSGMTGTGQILGTPEYMSPEQARGEKVDFRSDIYALGIVVYEIFTGRVPFKGPTPMATLFMHVQEPPPLEGAVAARIPAALVSVLRRALAKDAKDRYGSVREMLAAIVQARATELPDAAPVDAGESLVPTLPSAKKIPKRASSGWLIGALVVAAAGGVLTVREDLLSTLLASLGARPAPAPATSEPVSPSPAPASGVAPPSAADPPTSQSPRSTDWTPPLTFATPSSAAPILGTPAGRVEGSESRPESPGAPPAPAAEKSGLLRLTVVPFAEVTIDEKAAGSVVSAQIPLSAGPHALVLVHPDFEPLKRTVDVVAGETLEVRVDLQREAVRIEKR